MTTFDPMRPLGVLTVALCLVAGGAAQAQAVRPSARGTLQVPANPSATSTLPAGIDAGTPATSNSVPLGTPTMPANDKERVEIRNAAAAARAAARPKKTLDPVPAASAPDAGAALAGAGAATTPMVPGATRPVSASPPRPTTARSRVDCGPAGAASGPRATATAAANRAGCR